MIVPSNSEHIHSAARLLQAGGLVGMPTETVYGLAADASQSVAVAAIYQTKGRPANHPLIVHIAPNGPVTYWACNIPEYAYALMQAYWPGPMTLVLPRTEHAKDWVTGQQNSVGLRCPSHPVAQALLQQALVLGVKGFAAPSANRFGRVSPTTAQHVETEFEHSPLVLDGGACEVGIESTIIDCTGKQPKVLRHGVIGIDEISHITGLTVIDGVGHTSAPRVSGSLTAHYAPNTPLCICPLEALNTLKPQTVYLAWSEHITVPENVVVNQMPNDPKQYARQLYASLRALDLMDFLQIAVEPVPTHTAWLGVADRLQRAAATFAR